MPTRIWSNTQPLSATSTSSFACMVPQRSPVRLVTRAGPGFYEPLVCANFARYRSVNGTRSPHFIPGTRRQPFRPVSTSAQLRMPSTRFASTAARIDRSGVILGDGGPGPGAYNYTSQFDVHRPTFQPFQIAAAARSSIRDVYPDRRCGIICKPERLGSPGPHTYAPLPKLDRIRMTMHSEPLGSGIRVPVDRSRPLTAFVHSSANLSSTLSELAIPKR